MIAADATLRTLVPEGSAIGPASVDLHLGDTLTTVSRGAVLDPEMDQSTEFGPRLRRWDGRWLIEPLHGYLGVTRESIDVPNGWVAVLDGVSSLARLWLTVHVTGGYVDPGWSGPLTLEIVSLSNPVLLRPGQRIAQIRYHRLTEDAEHPYQGRYVGSGAEPVISRAFLDRLP